MYKVTRRKLLKILLVLLNPALILISNKANSHSQDSTGNDKEFNFEDFINLSKIITQQSYLDENVAKKIFQLMIGEPFGIEHMQSVYKKVKLQQIGVGERQQITFKPTDFTDGQQWFISHFLITWYTGIYYHNRGNKNISLKQALIYQRLSNIRTPPTYCSPVSMSWSRLPFSNS